MGATSDSDELTPDSSSKPLVQSFLSQLRAPGRSTLTRKRTVRQNFGPVARKKKPSCSTDPSSVTPSKIAEMRPTAAEIDSLGSFPFFSSIILQNLKAELSLYLAKASSVTVSPNFDTLMWWQNHASELPNWSEVVKDLVLVQPSQQPLNVFFLFIVQFTAG